MSYYTAPEGLEEGSSSLLNVGMATESTTIELPALIGNIINVLLGALGIVFVVLVIYAGFLYFTSEGEKEKTKKAKDILTTSIIGMVIIVAAYAISNYVMGALVGATT